MEQIPIYKAHAPFLQTKFGKHPFIYARLQIKQRVTHHEDVQTHEDLPFRRGHPASDTYQRVPQRAPAQVCAGKDGPVVVYNEGKPMSAAPPRGGSLRPSGEVHP